MFLGIDASTQVEVDKKNPHYYYDGKEVDPWIFLYKHNDVKSMRLRLWLNPYDEKGRPYGGGTVDFDAWKVMAKRAQDIGYDILLDIHYSDFWCDPGKQFIPKAWRNLSVDELALKVYEYTKDTLLEIKKEGIKLSSIQIGNEITNGMLWPLGKLGDKTSDGIRSNYDNLALFLRNGIKGAREINPDAKLIIHLEKSYDVETHEEFFREVIKRGVNFDVIGLSYYPYWHGTFPMFFKNVDNLKEKFNKPIWIVETGYGFTMEPFVMNGNYGDNLISEDFFKQENVYHPYPLSKDGQKDFLTELLRLSEEHDIEGIYYWEPFWLPLDGLCWATEEGEAFTSEIGKPTHNEWANQCLFDYDGNATPGLDAFKIK